MLFLIATVILLVIASAQDIIPSNTPDGKGLLFSNTDAGLPWPIVKPSNIGAAMAHGPHCLKVVAQLSTTKPKSRSIDAFHFDHCRHVLQQVSQLSDLDVLASPSFCKDAVMNEDSFCGFCYFIVYRDSNATNVTPQTLFKSLLKPNKHQDDLFVRLSGANFGTILMKVESGAAVSEQEKAFYDSWKSDRAIRLAALGISCSLGHGKIPKELIQYAIELESI